MKKLKKFIINLQLMIIKYLNLFFIFKLIYSNYVKSCEITYFKA